MPFRPVKLRQDFENASPENKPKNRVNKPDKPSDERNEGYENPNQYKNEKRPSKFFFGYSCAVIENGISAHPEFLPKGLSFMLTDESIVISKHSPADIQINSERCEREPISFCPYPHRLPLLDLYLLACLYNVDDEKSNYKNKW